MQIEISDQADRLKDEWWDLWHRDPCATPFQTPACLLPWRRHFADGENVILTLRRDGRLIGLLPLFRLNGRLLLWGAGTSDWLGGVFDPALEPKALSLALMRLGEPLELFQLSEESLLTKSLVPDEWEERRSKSESCAVLPLPAQLSPRMRQNLRYYRRRAARAAVDEPTRMDAAHVGSLADLHARRWSERGEAGVFADQRFLAWLKEAAILLDAAGLLHLYALRMAGQPVAMLCVLEAKRKAFYYIGGFDPELAQLGLGTVLVGHAIAEAERAGLAEFDFLRGQEDYKYRWGAADRTTCARYLAPARRSDGR